MPPARLLSREGMSLARAITIHFRDGVKDKREERLERREMLVALVLLMTWPSPLHHCRAILRQLDRSEASTDESSVPQWKRLRCAELMLRGSGSRAQTLVHDRATTMPTPSNDDAAAPCRTLLRRMDVLPPEHPQQAALGLDFDRINCSSLMLRGSQQEARVLVGSDS